MISDMKINIITVNRAPNNYIFNTVTSLQKSNWQQYKYPVTVCAGSADDAYLQELPDDIDILRWREIVPKTKGLGFNLNYVRALRHGFNGLILLEDDITFCQNWLTTVHQAIDEIPHKRYALALYSPNDLSHSAFDRGVHYRSYYAPMFYGTQAMYFPETVRYEIADYIYEHRFRLPSDLLIGEWANTNNCLYALLGSVVQHAGRVSTGIAGHDHTAWNLLCDNI
jgi:hypothetical protein